MATFSMVISSMVMGQVSFFAMAASTNTLNMWRGICCGCAKGCADRLEGGADGLCAAMAAEGAAMAAEGAAMAAEGAATAGAGL